MLDRKELETMEVHYNDPVMPEPIAAIIAEIAATIEAAHATATETEGERTYTYASADDVFAAIQRPMSEKGLVCYLLDGGFEILTTESGVVLHATFVPVLQIPGCSFEDGRAQLHMVAPLEGLNTSAAMRTLAEKTYLRNLFKLPSLKPEQPEQQSAGPSAAESVPGSSAAESSLKRPRALKNPIGLSKDDSEKERARIIEEMNAAENVAELSNAFRKNQEIYPRLKQVDSQLVRATYNKLERQLEEGGKAS